MTKKRKNVVIAIAMIAVLAIAGISAYFTATDSNTNSFTVGKVDIDQQEPNWPEDSPPTNIVPNQEFAKDPLVVNTGNNDAYVFTAVAVPKKKIKVGNTTSGVGGSGGTASTTAVNPAVDDDEVMTQLFQLNEVAHTGSTGTGEGALNAGSALTFDTKTGTGVTAGVGGTFSIGGELLPVAYTATANKAVNDADTWTGVDTWSDDWKLIDVNAEKSTSLGASVFTGSDNQNLLDHYNVYLFAYTGSNSGTTNATVKAVKPGAEFKTSPVFNSVTFANVVNINDVLGTDEDSLEYISNIEEKTPQIIVKSFAIQAENVADNSNGSTDAATVWNILNNQDGAYRALADQMFDLSRDWWTNSVDHHNKSVSGS